MSVKRLHYVCFNSFFYDLNFKTDLFNTLNTTKIPFTYLILKTLFFQQLKETCGFTVMYVIKNKTNYLARKGPIKFIRHVTFLQCANSRSDSGTFTPNENHFAHLIIFMIL